MRAKQKHRDWWRDFISTRRLVTTLAALALLYLGLRAFFPASFASGTPQFTLILRSQDPLLYAAGALKHYAACSNVGAVRILRDTSSAWNLTAAHYSLAREDIDDGVEDDGILREALRNALDDAAVPQHLVQLLDASPPPGGAVLLVSDDMWIDCSDVARAFDVWRNQTEVLVGTLPLGHLLRFDGGHHDRLDYKVSSGVDEEGAYSMVSLNGAFVNARYLERVADVARRRTGKSRGVWAALFGPGVARRGKHLHAAAAALLSPGCDEIWLNHHVAASLDLAPIYVHARFDNHPHAADFTTGTSLYLNSLSICLSRLASENAGRLDLIWTRSSAVADHDRLHHRPSLHGVRIDEFSMVDDSASHLRGRYLLSDDRVAGVSVVLVMETKPNEVASAVRHLRKRHAFIREAVVWNNQNETMNHHMFPYDIAVRYVMAPKNYRAYARYLGCLLARYEICYFQHETTRPLFVAGLYTAFLSRPDVIVAASDPKSALIARLNMTMFDPSAGRMVGLADMDEGAMVHKDLVRQFVDRMSLDDSRSFYERTMNADLYFTASQPRPPMIVTHTTWTNNKPRVFPTSHRVGKALAFAFTFAPSREPAQGFLDSTSQRQKYFKAPCTGKESAWRVESCAFATSIDAWPRPLFVDFGHNTTALKPARHYAEVYEEGLASDENAPIVTRSQNADSPELKYHWAVDGDLKTVWVARTPKRGPAFLGLQLLSPQTVVGVNLWCSASAPFEPAPRLQLGFYGDTRYHDASCGAHWTSDGNLHLLKYDCPPMAFVTRVRLVVEAPDLALHVAEFAVAKLDSPIMQSVRNYVECSLPPVPPSLPAPACTTGDGNASSSSSSSSSFPLKGSIVYAIQGELEDFLRGEKLAFLEEACELGGVYPRKVKLVYAGSSKRVSLKTLAQTLAAGGSTCDLQTSVSYEAVPVVSVRADAWEPGATGAATSTAEARNADPDSFSQRRIDVYEWWLKRNLDARVVMFDPHNSLMALVLRGKRDNFPGTVFVARSARVRDNAEESLVQADASTVSSKAELIIQAQGPVEWSRPRRISYPMRTLRTRPDPDVQEPGITAIEELIVLVTPATTPADMHLFNTNALPILQQKADVRIVNLTALARDLAQGSPPAPMTTPSPSSSPIEGGTFAPAAAIDATVKRPKWTTLNDVVYYVAIYPARVLWILEASLGSTYYASLASAGSARFVAAPEAVPHWESRMLAWNSTCEWTAEGFAGKARELIQGRFNASSAFLDRGHLRHDAADVVVEEWPIKRTLAPFVNTIQESLMMLAEAVSANGDFVE